MDVENAASRWAQLTYASFDRGDGAGGWQVKESRGGLEPGEIESLSALFVTAFDSHAPLPEYPTPSDIAAQPRRFAYLLVHRNDPDAPYGRVVGEYIHAVQSGSDSTGRPGNVFTHAVLDRFPTDPEPQLRPIELWRSFDLLTPYGSDQVLAAVLPDGAHPTAAGMVGLDMVVDFLFDPATWRIGILSVLLDALDEAMLGGRRVLIVSPSSDQAALWIAAVCRLMPSSTARGVSFSVYERAARLASLWERGTLIASIPVEDLASLDEDDLARWIVVRDGETPALGQSGHSPHRTALGSEVTPTNWSQLAQEVLLERSTAEDALRDLDDVAARVGDIGLHPQWPLAMAVLRVGDGGDTTLARSVAMSHLPNAALTDASLLANLLGAAEEMTDLGSTAADAWAALERLDAATPAFVRDAAVAGYLARALDDDAWLGLPGGAPLPTEPVVEMLAGRAIDVLRHRLDEDLEPATLLRIIDTASRAGLLHGAYGGPATAMTPPTIGSVGPGADSPPASDDASDIVERAVSRVLVPRLLRGADEAATADLPTLLDTRVVHHVVAHVLDAHPSAGRVGAEELFTPAAIEWLRSHGPSTRIDEAVGATEAGDAAPVLALGATDRAILLGSADAGSATPGVRASAALVRLAGHATWVTDPALRGITVRELWQARPLLAIETAFPGALPSEILDPTLACSDPAPDVTDLALAVAARRPVTEVVRTAVVRSWAALGSIPSGHEPNVRSVVVELVTRYGGAALAVFGPLLVDAAVTLGTNSVTGDDWTESELDALRAALETTALVDAASAVQSARSDTGASAVQRLAGLIAIALVDDGTVSDVQLPAQTRLLVRAERGDGESFVGALVDEALERTDADPAELASAVTEHLGDTGRSTWSERAVKAWIRARLAPGRLRSRSRDSKLGSSVRTDLKEN